MNIEWSSQQLEAIDGINKWRNSGSEQVYLLYGYAGTGKTTILQWLAANDPTIRVAAYTNNAVRVLRRKGCPNVSTIHRMIYQPNEKLVLKHELETLLAKQCSGWISTDENARIEELKVKLEKLEFTLKEGAFGGDDGDEDGYYPWSSEDYPKHEKRPSMLAIDEASVLDEQIGKDLMSFGIKMLVIMDPFQLQPIAGPGYFLDPNPDYMLKEIHRQAADSGIIRLATKLRNDPSGSGYIGGNFGSDVMRVKDVPASWFTDPEIQLLCGKNHTRHILNQRARRALGFKNELPEVGDLLVAWRTNRFIDLLIGSYWRVLAVDYNAPHDRYLSLHLRSEDEKDSFGVPRELECKAWKRNFLIAKPKEGEFWDKGYYNEFNYAYALTVHKAQGSEFPKVVLVDESYIWSAGKPNNWCGGERNNWLYTGATRAAQKLTVVQLPRGKRIE